MQIYYKIDIKFLRPHFMPLDIFEIVQHKYISNDFILSLCHRKQTEVKLCVYRANCLQGLEYLPQQDLNTLPHNMLKNCISKLSCRTMNQYS